MQDFRVATFLEVCHTMNYTEAAANLGLTQPAVSQHIAHLERSYGVKLLSYRSRKLSLTPAGEMLMQAATTVANDEHILKERMTALNDRRTILKLGATLTAGRYALAKPLARYLDGHPETELQLTSADTARLLALLADGQVDLVLLEGFLDRDRYGWRVLRSEPFICVCGVGHRPLPTPCALDALLSEHLITREPGSGTRALLESILAGSDLSLHDFPRVSQVGSIEIIKTLVTANCGIGFLYRSAVDKELEGGELREIPLAEGPYRHDFTFVWRKGSAFAPEYARLIDELMTCDTIRHRESSTLVENHG